MNNKLPSTLKVSFGEDVRRIALKSSNYSSLCVQITKLFPVKEGQFTIKYKDDEGDLVSLCSDIEYDEALRCTTNNILRLSIFENKVNKCKSKCTRNERKNENCDNKNNCKRRGRGRRGCPRRRNCNKNNNQRPNGRCGPFKKLQNLASVAIPLLPQILGNFAGNENVNVNENGIDGILQGILNGGACRVEHNYVCDGCEGAISGTRYHCSECKDFDFCSSCFETKKMNHFEGKHKFEEITALDALKDALNRNDIVIDAFLAPGNAKEEPKKQRKQRLEARHPAYCDRCKNGIVGIRYKCFDCADFDFCSKCHEEASGKEDIKGHKKHHQFGKIVNPNERFMFHKLALKHHQKRQRQQQRKKKREEQKKDKKEQKKVEIEDEKERIERKKKEIRMIIEEEKKRRAQQQIEIQKKRKELIKLEKQEKKRIREEKRKQKEEKERKEKEQQRKEQQEKEEQWIFLDSLAPMRNKEEKNEQKKEQKKEEEPKIVYPFEQKLKSLEEMGFTDRKKNIKLLIKHKGAILPTIQQLIN